MLQKTVKRGIGYISWGQTIHEVNIGGHTSLSIFTTIFAKLKPVLAAGGRNHSLMSLNDLLDTFSRAHAKFSLYYENQVSCENSAFNSIMITFRSHQSLLGTVILIIKNVLSSGFHQKPQTTKKLDLMPSGPWW